MGNGKRTAIGIALAIAVLALAACESADKAPAAAALTAAQTAIDAVKTEAMKYVPDQVKSVDDALATARANFEKKDYKAALAGAQDVAARAKELGAAAATKKAELTKSWEEISNGVPKMAEAIKSRVDILSQSKKLPAGLDKAKVDDAKAGLESMNQSWTQASDAYKSGDVSSAVAKAKAAKDKAVEIMTALNMTVPQAAAK
ncbi:MAG TPA: hypothetical protein VIF11_15340 [Methylomirabilota bacterium]|jgi:hypothetical protein